ncbi:hypothetical protein I553_8383 [Mycobacterium xenopi 4042]|uniref:Uncharacterized protein n=1 Tax=Mycobacterium xenopi 4042 TaxID=1299334 RepID=X8BJJ2_MYCXE|nr:hypothetical protein I553_8383 [Mycobacterium xenopi 4042]
MTFPGVVSPDITLAPCGAAPRPVFSSQWRAIWRTSLLPTGPVTARISRAAPNAVEGVAWGSGAEEFLDALPAMLGADDDASDFLPQDATVAAAHRRLPHLRLGRTGRVLEALIPAILEQRVPGPTPSDPGGCWSPNSARPRPVQRRPRCGCRRRPRYGERSRRGNFIAQTSTRGARAPSSPAHSGRHRWNGWWHCRRNGRGRRWPRCPEWACGPQPRPRNEHSVTPTRCRWATITSPR